MSGLNEADADESIKQFCNRILQLNKIDEEKIIRLKYWVQETEKIRAESIPLHNDPPDDFQEDIADLIESLKDIIQKDTDEIKKIQSRIENREFYLSELECQLSAGGRKGRAKSGKSKKSLQNLCKTHGITGYSKLNVKDLTKLLKKKKIL